MECRKCHDLGHTADSCTFKLPAVKMDDILMDEKAIKSMSERHLPTFKDDLRETNTEGDDHLEKYHAS
eukprot:CAMPEP_0183728542 /NCGR_PEP_ID=MMETSP0737-20130205/28300_1 /TAXON_ID=385413 /ORGANISM="Thalassiosira miniscula, Strain CCMP1093" /LENGTH=67 /DNA_ID=CAMNT_0025960511 /DNA_START=116 /DNA_END=319 /DNA_ORIENTATION=-